MQAVSVLTQVPCLLRRGGKAFVASQALGWALFSTALFSLFWVVTQVAQGFAYCVRCWAVMTSSFMLAAQLVRPPCTCVMYVGICPATGTVSTGRSSCGHNHQHGAMPVS